MSSTERAAEPAPRRGADKDKDQKDNDRDGDGKDGGNGSSNNNNNNKDGDADMKDAEPEEEEILDEELLSLSTQDLQTRKRLLENDARIMKSEFQRLSHEKATMGEKIKENMEKIANNRCVCFPSFSSFLLLPPLPLLFLPISILVALGRQPWVGLKS